MSKRAFRLPNDFDMERWRDLDDVWTDSLWLIPARDRSGAHSNDYHGNFVPQVPRQLIRRYTRPGELVLDGFLGSGTTMLEANALGRHCIGVELNGERVAKTRRAVAAAVPEHSPHSWQIIHADLTQEATAHSIRAAVDAVPGADAVSMVILHPPYHDIIKFSNHPNDLSNAESVGHFRLQMKRCIDVATDMLAPGRCLAIVIGDKYSNAEWVPLGFYCMDEALRLGFRLKSVVVKDINGNRAKANQQNLWRYRALMGGYYVFKHEYVIVFQAPGDADHGMYYDDFEGSIGAEDLADDDEPAENIQTTFTTENLHQTLRQTL